MVGGLETHLNQRESSRDRDTLFPRPMLIPCVMNEFEVRDYQPQCGKYAQVLR